VFYCIHSRLLGRSYCGHGPWRASWRELLPPLRARLARAWRRMHSFFLCLILFCFFWFGCVEADGGVTVKEQVWRGRGEGDQSKERVRSGQLINEPARTERRYRGQPAHVTNAACVKHPHGAVPKNKDLVTTGATAHGMGRGPLRGGTHLGHQLRLRSGSAAAESKPIRPVVDCEGCGRTAAAAGWRGEREVAGRAPLHPSLSRGRMSGLLSHLWSCHNLRGDLRGMERMNTTTNTQTST
jgi:hypothetical protein